MFGKYEYFISLINVNLWYWRNNSSVSPPDGAVFRDQVRKVDDVLGLLMFKKQLEKRK